MEAQRLRNLTTGRLHTQMADVYEDVEWVIGERGVMTHQLPNVVRAIEPWLREMVTDQRFWDGKYDREHVGEVHLRQMTGTERHAFFVRYNRLPSLL